MGAAYLGAAVIGVTSKVAAGATEPAIEKLSFWGMPGTVTLAIVAKAAAAFGSGDFQDYANGLGDAAAIIAISRFVQGQEVSGVAAYPAHGRTRAAVEESLRRRLRETMSEDDIDAELAALANS